MPVTRLLLADDEMLVRAGLRLILDGTQGISVVGEAGDGLAAVQAVTALRPDVVLLDIRMPGMDGVEAAGRIRDLPQPPAVVMLTAFDADGFVVDALDAGAQGFLLKSAPPEQIVAAVLGAAAGELPFTPSVLRQVVAMATRARLRAPVDDPLRDLSERERAVACAVADGLSNAEIAERLVLSQASVKTYLNRIFGKTGVTNRVQLALLVERARLGG